MIKNILFVYFVVFPVFLSADMNYVKKNFHFKLYDELTSHHPFETREYWISMGKMQAYSEIIECLDCDMNCKEYL